MCACNIIHHSTYVFGCVYSYMHKHMHVCLQSQHIQQTLHIEKSHNCDIANLHTVHESYNLYDIQRLHFKYQDNRS